ncbi:MAG: acyclic terpene utilization AtuA family protein [Deltaproteobacteria bacterium]
MAEPIRIANCSGFFGDRLSAAREMVEDGPIDVLTGDWLAELTMLILARKRAKRPSGGYAQTFVRQMEDVMGTCLDKGIKVVSNAGGLDPDGCADAVAQVAAKLGLHPKIAYVSGDDLLPTIAERAASGELRHFETGAKIEDTSAYMTANAYLGCWGIVEALHQGADIVITGRATDAAIVCGPAAWHHGWSRMDYDQLAGAVTAGHVIECSTQATGGNYSFFHEIPDLIHPGFPWAEVAADGSSVIGKHAGTAGEVNTGTVTSQLLYEIGSPAYLGPDVTSRFDTIELEQLGPDRVRMHGIRGEAPPETLKVCINKAGGFRSDVNICLTGLDIEKKAALIEEAFWAANPYDPEDYAFVKTRLLRNDRADPDTNEGAVAIWRCSVKDPDEKKVGRPFTNAMIELALASIPGFFGVGGGPGPGRPYGVLETATIPAASVPQAVTLLGMGGSSTEVSSVIPHQQVTIDPPAGPTISTPDGATRKAPLGLLFGARSGDKGGNANVGIFARSDAAWAFLDDFLSTAKLRELLPEARELPVDRHRLPALRSLNFVLHGFLEEGVAASTRQDPQAKSLGEWLRARVVEIPESLLP